jgi:hypothetical protein
MIMIIMVLLPVGSSTMMSEFKIPIDGATMVSESIENENGSVDEGEATAAHGPVNEKSSRRSLIRDVAKRGCPSDWCILRSCMI